MSIVEDTGDFTRLDEKGRSDPRILLAAPPHIRERALAIAAAHAEQEYRADPALTDFEAFGEDDLLDATE